MNNYVAKRQSIIKYHIHTICRKFYQKMSLLRAVLEGNYEEVIRLVSAGQSPNAIYDNGNTLLHITAETNNLPILKFLLLRDGTEIIDYRNFFLETPLYISLTCRNYETAELLIDAGASVNLSNYEGITPLHISDNLNVSHMLISKGADLNMRNSLGDTPLHCAIVRGCLESVCMLLYYNADTNAINELYSTPFMVAMSTSNLHIQDILLNYVDDFDLCYRSRFSILELALIYNSPILESIMKTDTTSKISTVALHLCTHRLPPHVFKLVWSRLEYDDENPIPLFQILHTERMKSCAFEFYLQLIIESSNTDLLLQLFQGGFFSRFIDAYFARGLSLNLLTKLTCALLQTSYIPTTEEIQKIFCYYGISPLLRMLLFMEYTDVWTPSMLTCGLLFDIHVSISEKLKRFRPNQHFSRKDILCYLQYSVGNQFIYNYCNRHLKECITNPLPRIPTLIQLARDQTRNYLVNNFNISKTSQYYTLINNLDISEVYKKILTFETKLYSL